MVGLLDGFGLTMFMPLLEMLDGNGTNQEFSKLINIFTKLLDSLNISFDLISVLSFMLIFFCLKGAFKFLEGYCRVSYQQMFMRNIRVNNTDALVNLGYNQFAEIESGRIQNTFSSEVSRVNLSFLNFFLSIQSSVLLVVYIAMALTANVEFAIMVAIGGGVTNIFFRFLYKRTKSASKDYSYEAQNFEALLIQKVANFKYLKATGAVFLYALKLKERIFSLEKVQKRLGLLDVGMQAIREPIIMTVVVVVMVIQIKYMS